jgi:hypothetical protein
VEREQTGGVVSLLDFRPDNELRKGGLAKSVKLVTVTTTSLKGVFVQMKHFGGGSRKAVEISETVFERRGEYSRGCGGLLRSG